jgi:hypothetical protein
LEGNALGLVVDYGLQKGAQEAGELSGFGLVNGVALEPTQQAPQVVDQLRRDVPVYAESADERAEAGQVCPRICQ